ncbi:hypothetical protein ACU686_27055 [Yinghuangia aomiensis]
MPGRTVMDGYARLIEDNDSLRDLIQRWRSTTDSAAELLPTAARTLAATARAKDQVLYPAIRNHAPERAALVDEAERINTHVLGFLGQAVEIRARGIRVRGERPRSDRGRRRAAPARTAGPDAGAARGRLGGRGGGRVPDGAGDAERGDAVGAVDRGRGGGRGEGGGAGRA